MADRRGTRTLKQHQQTASPTPTTADHLASTGFDTIPFTVTYYDDQHIEQLLGDDRLLALIRFHTLPVTPSDPRIFTIPLQPMDGNTAIEVWRSTQPVKTGVINGVHYAENKDILLLHTQYDEFAPDALQPLAAAAYRQLFTVARARGYPHFLRIWNFLPNINEQHNGLERYQAFCAGRHQALVAELAEFENHLPAASGLGTHQPGLHLLALASKTIGIQIENPRQTSAFHYPRQYGFRSPSFSRAILKTWKNEQQHLYISGTASIVGHASQHPETMAQLDETLLNLEALLNQAQCSSSKPLRMALLRIYCRMPLNPAPLRLRIAQAFDTDVPMIFLHADICRRELLIEIEGLAVTVL